MISFSLNFSGYFAPAILSVSYTHLFLELTSGLEPPNLLITNEVLYRLSYVSKRTVFDSIKHFPLFFKPYLRDILYTLFLLTPSFRAVFTTAFLLVHPSAAYCRIPVSYTHLDVYKRQDLFFLLKSVFVV